MVIRLISVSDQMQLPDFHDVFRAVLGWSGDLGYIIRLHGQEFNSFGRKTRAKVLHEFKAAPAGKVICDTLHMWEWDVRVLDIQDGVADDHAPVCMGAAGRPPADIAAPGALILFRRQVAVSTAVCQLLTPGARGACIACRISWKPRGPYHRSQLRHARFTSSYSSASSAAIESSSSPRAISCCFSARGQPAIKAHPAGKMWHGFPRWF